MAAGFFATLAPAVLGLVAFLAAGYKLVGDGGGNGTTATLRALGGFSFFSAAGLAGLGAFSFFGAAGFLGAVVFFGAAGFFGAAAFFGAAGFF